MLKQSHLMYQRISGNKAAYGAGVYTQGDFVLNSGTVAKNVADRSGGGVMLDSGLFAMRDDSEIKDNVAGVEGGGIMLQEGNFMLAGGAITGNAAGKAGGGIYVGSRSVIELVERPSVINNTVGKSANNVLLEDPEQSPLRLEGLRASDGIGVSTDAGLAAEPPIVFTSGFGKGDPTKIFSSDDPAYAVGLNSQGEAFLGLPVTVSFEPGDEVTGEMPPVTTASGGIYEVPVCQYRH
ncbi:MAG: hypothetical protein IJ781_07850, partial [Atopobiaceae bacterium]|nr:hypothetical protein [Atopobiaceae bacterium]